MDELLEIMKTVRPDIDFTKEKLLIDEDILDSFDIISIVSEVNNHFGVNISVRDLLPEYFNSAEALFGLIEKLQNNSDHKNSR